MNYITKNIECFLDNWCELQDNILTLQIDDLNAAQAALFDEYNNYKHDIYAHKIDTETGTLSIEWKWSDLLGMYLNRKAEYEYEENWQRRSVI